MEQKMRKRKQNSNSELPQNKKMRRSCGNNSARSFKSRDATNDNFTMSDERLKAYGLNPKRYKNKIKYGRSDH